jgi:hypothetical protein
MTMTENDRAVMGGNRPPDWAHLETERLKSEYVGYRTTATELLELSKSAPEIIDNNDDMLRTAALVKRIADLDARVEETRKVEKEPHLRCGNAVDQYFGSVRAFLFRAKKTDKPGIGDTLQARIDNFNQRKAAEERRVREETERKAREEANRLARVREENERKEREAREAAERARKPERIAELEQAANVAAEAVAQTKADESIARADLSNARADMAAPTADLVRTRGDDGVLVTMRQEGFAEVTDSSKLDAVTLWAFVKEDAKAAAFRAWAKMNQFRKEMAGGVVGFRDKTVIR